MSTLNGIDCKTVKTDEKEFNYKLKNAITFGEMQQV